MTRRFQCFRSFQNQSETIKLLITLTKVSVVSSFHRFPGGAGGNSNWSPPVTRKIKLEPTPGKR